MNKNFKMILLSISILLMLLILYFSHAKVHAFELIAQSRQEQVKKTERVLQIEQTETELRNLKDRWKRLQIKRQEYVEKIQDVGGRWGRGTAKMLQTTLDYKNDLAALDEEIEKAYKKWEGELSLLDYRLHMARDAKRRYFEETEIYKKLNDIHMEKSSKLFSEYVARINEIKRKDYEYDLEKELDAEQAEIFSEKKRLTKILNKLRSSTDAQIDAEIERKKAEIDKKIEASKTQDEPNFFSACVEDIDKDEIRLKVGETKLISIKIEGGVFPVDLKIRFEDGHQENKIFNRRGIIKIPFNFFKPGRERVTLIFGESSRKKRCSTDYVSFLIEDVTKLANVTVKNQQVTGQPPAPPPLVTPSQFTVPKVIGLELATAEYDIREAGLRVGNIRTQENTQRAGVVIDQNPAGGSTISNAPGTNLTVDLTVSSGISVRAHTLYVDPKTKTIEIEETLSLRALLWHTDGHEEDVTTSPRTTWTGAPGGLFTPRQSGTFYVTATHGGLSGTATIHVREPRSSSWTPPISNADDLDAQVPKPPPDAYTWFAVCDKKVDIGAVTYGEHPDPTRYHIMAGPFPGPRTVYAWIEQNCPSWRCDIQGACATEPPPAPTGVEGYYVLCNKTTGAITVSKNFSSSIDDQVMAGPLLGEPAARMWIAQNCPSWRCTNSGQCARAPARGGDWRVICNKRTGEITLSKHAPDYMDSKVMASGFLGEPDARLWVDQNCPSWRCTNIGQCARTPARGGEWYVACDKAGEVMLGKKPIPFGYHVLAEGFLGEPDARTWTDVNCPSWRCDSRGRCVPGGKPYGPDSSAMMSPFDSSFQGFMGTSANREKRRDQEVRERDAFDQSLMAGRDSKTNFSERMEESFEKGTDHNEKEPSGDSEEYSHPHEDDKGDIGGSSVDRKDENNVTTQVDCKELREEHMKKFSEMVANYNKLNMELNGAYSGANGDVAGFLGAYITDAFIERYCNLDYVDCSKAALSEYFDCLSDCNEKWVNRKNTKMTRSKRREWNNKCNVEAHGKVKECIGRYTDQGKR